MHVMLSLNQLFFVTFGAAIALSLPGLLVLQAINKNRNIDFNTRNLSYSLVLGIFTFTSLIYILAILRVDISYLKEIVTWVYSILAIIVIIRSSRKKLLAVLTPILIAISIAFWMYLPALILMFKSGSSAGMITKGNSDVLYYSAVSNEFLKYGFENSGHLVANDLGAAAQNYLYFTPISISNFISHLFQLESWETSIPTILISVVFIVLGISRITAFFQKRDKLGSSATISLIILMSPLIMYIFSHYFLGQVFAWGVALQIIATMLELKSNTKFSLRTISELGFVLALCFYTYPLILVPFYFLVFFVLNVSSLMRERHKLLLDVCYFFLSLLIGFTLAAPYLKAAYLMSRALNAGQFGWSLPTLNPSAIFIWPQLIGEILPSKWNLIFWAFTFVGFVFFLTLYWRRENKRTEIVYLLIFATVLPILYPILTNKQYTDYNSWKLIAFLVPIFMLFFLLALDEFGPIGKVVTLILVGITITTSVSTWQTLPQTQSFSSRDLVSIRDSKVIQSLESISINLPTYFETMSMATLLQKQKLSFISPSYFASDNNIDNCILTRNDNADYPFILSINQVYGIVIGGDNCEIQTPELVLGKAIFANTVSELVFRTGWSSPEAWGRWTDGKEAKILVPKPRNQESDLVMSLQVTSFVNKQHINQEVKIFVNGTELRRELFSDKNPDIGLEISIPRDLLSMNEGYFEIKFVLEDSISPQELKLSSDPRKLGIGIKSITFTQSKN